MNIRKTVLKRFLPYLVILLLPGLALSGSAEMFQSLDLRDDSRIVDESDLILVIEFSSEYCGYCRQLEQDFLMPMQRNSDYDDKILIRRVSMSDYKYLVDFEGRSVSTAEFASQYGVFVTPTLVFLDSNGVEMTEKLIGFWSRDYFGGFIDNSIDEAREKL